MSPTTRRAIVLVVTLASLAMYLYWRGGAMLSMALPHAWEWLYIALVAVAIIIGLGKERLIATAWHTILRERAHITLRFSPDARYAVPSRDGRSWRFRFGVYNSGPSAAQNAKLWLIAATQPRAPAVRYDQLPFQVARDGVEWVTSFPPTAIPLDPVSINPDEEELFEPLRAWISSDGQHVVARIDTKPGGDSYRWPIGSGETWMLQYEARAANAKAVRIGVRVFVRDGAVCVERMDVSAPSAWPS